MMTPENRKRLVAAARLDTSQDLRLFLDDLKTEYVSVIVNSAPEQIDVRERSYNQLMLLSDLEGLIKSYAAEARKLAEEANA